MHTGVMPEVLRKVTFSLTGKKLRARIARENDLEWSEQSRVTNRVAFCTEPLDGDGDARAIDGGRCGVGHALHERIDVGERERGAPLSPTCPGRQCN